MRFQVTFEGRGLITGMEGDGGFNWPWTIFGGVGNLPRVMGYETGFKILGEAGVMSGWSGFSNEDVDIVKFAQFSF